MFDMLEELAAIHREVALTGGGETVSVVVTRTYRADVADVWDALTRPERLRRWFHPITGDLVVGGSFQLEGNAGGDVLRCEEPTRFVVTFGGPESIVEVRLEGADDATTVVLTHAVPLAMAGSGAGALFVGPGWDGALLGLSALVHGESRGNALEVANTPELVEFNRGSIERWVRAVEDSGTAGPEEIAGGRAMAEEQYTTLPS